MTPSLVIAPAAAAVVLVLLAGAAYRRGRRDGSSSLPDAVVAELADHKLRCLGESPPRVEIELACLFGHPPLSRPGAVTAGRPGDASAGHPPVGVAAGSAPSTDRRRRDGGH